MIAFLKGRMEEITPTHAFVDVNGVGYQVAISLKTYSEIQKQKEVFLHTQFIVREDAQILFGFSETQEKEMFNLLLSVNGVGPASALMFLSTLTISEIYNAIASGNAAILQSVKGIGLKTAQRIIIDLKDKVLKLEITDKSSATLGNKIKEQALIALEVLGISPKISDKLIDKIVSSNAEITVEELIKQVLKNK